MTAPLVQRQCSHFSCLLLHSTMVGYEASKESEPSKPSTMGSKLRTLSSLACPFYMESCGSCHSSCSIVGQMDSYCSYLPPVIYSCLWLLTLTMKFYSKHNKGATLGFAPMIALWVSSLISNVLDFCFHCHSHFHSRISVFSCCLLCVKAAHSGSPLMN